MIMDYCEQEISEGQTFIHIGLQFEDEPDSLYVAELEVDDQGVVKHWQLFFNGFDCKYNFRPTEKEEMIHYAAQQGISIREVEDPE
ncbi:hypothetical protein GC096_10500 [Paenibacillus sp. LMG 31461]|uniref:Uncharacterized protein n=1 Tax=Paenibacillus plantarum TaxID=2654975 RepID=A0ABX1X7N4_9BACL|nr:hypothetical protein [Paenibacillus plantarum]NOU64458.1 hypothetical protein [Paenibacillus plantarum]